MPVNEGEDAEVLDPQEDPQEETPQFDPRYADAFVGLNFLGALSREIDWLGHKILIRTLTTDEHLAVATLTREFLGTTELPRAYATAIVALCVDLVDGESLPVPIGETKNSYAWAFQRFNYVKSNWYPFTITTVYQEYLALETQAEEVLASMGNASGWTESPTPGLNANSV